MSANEMEELDKIMFALNKYSSSEYSNYQTFGSLSIEDKIDSLRECVLKLAMVVWQSYQEPEI